VLGSKIVITQKSSAKNPRRTSAQKSSDAWQSTSQKNSVAKNLKPSKSLAACRGDQTKKRLAMKILCIYSPEKAQAA
jgi:hypothetical protein